jgi:hypothetical protein
MLVFGMPVSWIVIEVLSLVLFFFCMRHAMRQPSPFSRVMELFGFVLGAAIFENIGVSGAHAYYYDVRRIMMIGDVPLEILLLEASIWYSAFTLCLRLKVPVLVIPLVVGLLGSVQDMTVDPAAVYDRYELPAEVAAEVNETHPGALGEGKLSGQWNWTDPGYQESFFGIPVYNWSGWMWLMAFYTIWVLVGRALYQRTGSEWVGAVYPFAAGVLNVMCLGSPLSRLLLFGNLDVTQSTLHSELVMVCLNYGIAAALFFAFRRRYQRIDLGADGLIVVALPVFLHCVDIVYVILMGNSWAYPPVLLVSALHSILLLQIYRWSRHQPG